MNQREVNFVSMCRALQRVLANYQTTWMSMPAFIRQTEQFTQSFNDLSAAMEDAEIVTGGITDQKADAELSAVRLAVNLAKRASVYALEQNNLELYEQLRVSKSALLRRPDNLTLAKLQDIYSRLSPLVNQLADYAVTSADIVLLEQLINTFERLISTPRVAIVTRKSHNQDAIPGLLSKLRLCLYKMDNLVNTFSDTPFLQEYKYARMTVDSGLRHEPPAGS